MKKLIFIPLLWMAMFVNGQIVCLQTQCTAYQGVAGNPVTIGAIFTSTDALSSFTVSQKSGPNTSTVTPQSGIGYNTSLSDTLRAVITGTVAGVYTYQFSGVDNGGHPFSGIDSLIVSALPTQTITISSVTVTLPATTVTVFGVSIPIPATTISVPAGQGTKVTVNGQVISF